MCWIDLCVQVTCALGFHGSDNVVGLARVFRALSDCWVDLKKYYDEVNKLAFLAYIPTRIPDDPSKALPKLVYKRFLSRAGQPTSEIVDLGSMNTAMYIAMLSDTNQEVIVKFTARYNAGAHHLLANDQLAPKLHFCERVIGGLYMVIIDRVDLAASRGQNSNLRDPNILYVGSEDRLRLGWEGWRKHFAQPQQ